MALCLVANRDGDPSLHDTLRQFKAGCKNPRGFTITMRVNWFKDGIIAPISRPTSYAIGRGGRVADRGSPAPSAQLNEGFVSWRGFPTDRGVALPRAELCVCSVIATRGWWVEHQSSGGRDKLLAIGDVVKSAWLDDVACAQATRADSPQKVACDLWRASLEHRTECKKDADRKLGKSGSGSQRTYAKHLSVMDERTMDSRCPFGIMGRRF